MNWNGWEHQLKILLKKQRIMLVEGPMEHNEAKRKGKTKKNTYM